MRKEIINLIDNKSRAWQLVGSCFLFVFGILLLIIWVSYGWADWFAVLLIGIFAIGSIIGGIYLGFQGLFCERVIIDFERKEISFCKMSLIKIPFQSVNSISAKRDSHGNFSNYIQFHLISGKTVKYKGYSDWYSRRLSEQKTEVIIGKLNDVITNSDRDRVSRGQAH